jgi:two-component system nitrate/nitrite response regulator NarL
MIDVVIVGRRSLFVELLASFLRSRKLGVAQAAPTPGACSTVIAELGPALCLIDARDLDHESVLGLVAVAAGWSTRVVVVSRTVDAEAIEEARAAGAVGYLHSSTGIESVADALDRVQAGHRVTCRPRTPLPGPRVAAHGIHRLAATLTGRERECLSLLVEGLGTTEMAARLSISEQTVRSHVQAVLYKLGAHSRLEAASLAVRHDLHDGLLSESTGAG